MIPPDSLEEIHGITQRRDDPPATIVLEERLGHRVTQRAWNQLGKHYGTTGLVARLRAVLDSLAPIAYAAARNQHVLCTNYDFGPKTDRHSLYYRPNQAGGITITLAGEDHA